VAAAVYRCMTHENRSGAAIVTGASRGLGRGVAAALAARGFPVVLVARDGALLERVASELPGQTLALAADVSDEDAVARLVAEVAARFGEIAVLVNVAGAPSVLRPPDELGWDEWRTPIDVDVRGVFNTTRAVAPALADGATIVNFASGAVVVGSALHVSYSPGQAALLSLSRCLGAWLEPRGAVTHCVCPTITAAGGVGRAAMEVFGAQEGVSGEAWFEKRFGADALTPEQTGDAVVTLLDEREAGDWVLVPAGLQRWHPLAQPVVSAA
jgi:3-oxoacyl-[acyl-carrier protein] reductase